MIVEKRADGKVETEATIKIWVDGERYVRTAEGNGPVHALDRALRAAITETHPHLARHRARELQGPHPRRDQGHGRGHHACCSTPPTATTSGARSASRRTSSRPRGRRSSTRSSTACSPARARSASARPRVSVTAPTRSRSPSPSSATRRSELVLEVLRSGQLSLGPRVPALRAGASPRALGVAHASAVSSGTAGLHLALRAVGVTDGDEVVTLAVLVRRQRQRGRSSSARGRCSPTSTRSRSTSTPTAARGRGDRAHDRAAARSTSSATRPTCRRFERLGLPIVEDACEALGARPRRRHAGRRARPPGGLRLLRQQAADHRRGRDGHDRRRGGQGAHRLRAQPGPRARHGLARPRPPRLQLPPVATSPARSGSPSSSASTTMLAARARVAARVPRGARRPDREGLALPCEDGAATASAAAGSSSSSRCRAASTATTSSARCASAACSASPTCRRST